MGTKESLETKEEKVEGEVKEVNVNYYSDQTADTRILTDKDEIWFNAVAPVAVKDRVTASGKREKLSHIFEQSHTKSIVDEIARIKSPSIRQLYTNLDRLVLSANEIFDEKTGATYSIPYQVELHWDLKLAKLRLFYPGLAFAGAVILNLFAAWLIGFSVDKFFSAFAASFILVSLISLVGDQEILNRLAKVSKIDRHNAGNKSALKDGKSINLVLTAVLSLAAAIINIFHIVIHI
ncbi:MAG: hypothetical protein ABSF82_13690 [Candidatus Bathyarchaeia archaeon]|jgi:hypothetical protein